MYTIKQRKDIKQYMLFERHHLWRYWNGEEEKDGLSVMINNGGCAPLSRRRSRFSFFFQGLVRWPDFWAFFFLAANMS